ncbi:MAG TPA: outer membrane lipoprotein-sorting protein [Polyangiaceae bacterium]|nr:outer membrane lipoprotein-sorting protein [Polyangiaceae bacterium]
MKRFAPATALLALSVVLGPARAARGAESLSELVGRADRVLRGKTTAAVLDMHVHTKSFDRTYGIVFFGDDRGGTSRALVKILGPARFRGHGTLKTGGKLFLYDPSTDRVTVLSSSMLGDDWMGSHFTNDDLVKETDLAKDYRPKLLKEWTAPEGEKPATHYRIRLDPTPEAKVSWDHLILTLYQQGDAVIPTEEEYFRRAADERAERTLTFTDVKDVGGRTAPTRLTMHVASKAGEFTEIHYTEIRFDVDVPAAKFTEQGLRK